MGGARFTVEKIIGGSRYGYKKKSEHLGDPFQV